VRAEKPVNDRTRVDPGQERLHNEADGAPGLRSSKGGKRFSYEFRIVIEIRVAAAYELRERVIAFVQSCDNGLEALAPCRQSVYEELQRARDSVHGADRGSENVIGRVP
jgi:hypothetical protein